MVSTGYIPKMLTARAAAAAAKCDRASTTVWTKDLNTDDSCSCIVVVAVPAPPPPPRGNRAVTVAEAMAVLVAREVDADVGRFIGENTAHDIGLAEENWKRKKAIASMESDGGAS